MARPLTQSDLIFPTQSISISSTLQSLKRSALSITNRLSSISADSEFVASVSVAYGLPLVANERCGSWYIPPEKKAESVYFKSTDGHTGEWGFSLRRLNLQVLGTVGKFGGCIITDSTRRGKSMPDALSKTIPIWCCVMNRVLFADSGPHELFTPPQAVSASEHAQIEKRIDRFVREFLDICRPNIKQLRTDIKKPLRPLWVTQNSSLPNSQPAFPDFHPIVLCTASRRVNGAEASEGGYIQGAADDHEAWAGGLTPKIFWSNKDKLLSTNEDQLPSLIVELIKEERGPDAIPVLIRPTTSLYVSKTQNLDTSPFDVVISCAPKPLTTTNANHLKTKRYLHLQCQTGKLGSRDLRVQLAHLPNFFARLPSAPGKILVCCPTGRDLSVGVALAILCLYADDEGDVSPQRTNPRIDKTFIKRRLTWLTTTDPTFNPPRGTLQSVNAILMPDPSSTASTPLPLATPPISTFILLNPDGTIPMPNYDATPEPNATTDHSTPSKGTRLHLPFTIFASLQNTSAPWSFVRTLTSSLPTLPSGTVSGTATFIARPSSPSSLLYAEEGDFVTSTGLRFSTRRKYVYRLTDVSGSAISDATNPGTDDEPHIAVHFVEEGGSDDAIGSLFVEMGPVDKGSDGVLCATNREQHLCAADVYAASWRFGDGMVRGGEGESKGEVWWEVRYEVNGPKKDYVSETRYVRGPGKSE